MKSSPPRSALRLNKNAHWGSEGDPQLQYNWGIKLSRGDVWSAHTPCSGGRVAPSCSGVLDLGEIGGNEVQISKAKQLTVISFSCSAPGRSGSLSENPMHTHLAEYL